MIHLLKCFMRNPNTREIWFHDSSFQPYDTLQICQFLLNTTLLDCPLSFQFCLIVGDLLCSTFHIVQTISCNYYSWFRFLLAGFYDLTLIKRFRSSIVLWPSVVVRFLHTWSAPYMSLLRALVNRWMIFEFTQWC